MREGIIDGSETLLSADEIAARLATYDEQGRFAAGLAALWADAGEAMLAATRAHWRDVIQLPHNRVLPADAKAALIQSALDDMRFRLSAPFDAAWIARVASLGRRVFHTDVPAHLVAIGLHRHGALLEQALRDRFADDPARLSAHVDTVRQLMMVELELLLTQVRLLDRQRAADRRGAAGERFRAGIADRLRVALDDSSRLRAQTDATSSAAGEMRCAAAEVAGTAERSAGAMAEAAATASGLTHAIEATRAQVDGAAEVAERAATASNEALALSEALSDHAGAIESILGLIRAIARQTNLLALNATIEAARAGDAGRGFAIVAQEVKSLAGQTRRAIDDIAAKIAAIQAATRQTVDANGSIRDTVGEVQGAARRIRRAMEAQAQAVAMITSAVDESALAASAIAETIGRIRTRTENVEQDVRTIAAGSREVDGELAELEGITADFVARMAS